MTKRSIRAATIAALAITFAARAASAQAPTGATPKPVPPIETQFPGTQAPASPPESLTPSSPQGESAARLTPARLEQMLAPIALYPDPLLADILMAATYPLDVVEAARWVEDPHNASLKGDSLLAALQAKTWDPSVKSLARFPRILAMMDARLDWTEELGEAFLADPGPVMDAIQRLRRRASSAERLVSTPQETIVERRPVIAIETPSPEVVYVPVCDPSVVYGPWPYPAFPPYSFPAFFGGAIAGAYGCGWIGGPIVAPLFVLSVIDFRGHRIDIDRDRDRHAHHVPKGEAERRLPNAMEEWRHDPAHRGNVPYRDAEVRARFAASGSSSEMRRGLGDFLTSPSPPISAPGAPQLQRRGGKVGADFFIGRPGSSDFEGLRRGVEARIEGGRAGPPIHESPRALPRYPSKPLRGLDGLGIAQSLEPDPRTAGINPSVTTRPVEQDPRTAGINPSMTRPVRPPFESFRPGAEGRFQREGGFPWASTPRTGEPRSFSQPMDVRRRLAPPTGAMTTTPMNTGPGGVRIH